MNNTISPNKQESPLTLRDLDLNRCWVAWQNERDLTTRKPRKVPYIPFGWGKAASDNPKHWGRLDEAVARVKTLDKPLGLAGVGIVLGRVDDDLHLCGIDLDSCINPKTGQVAQWAQDILSKFDSYAEVSPSGTGVKTFFIVTDADMVTVQEVLGHTDRGKPKTGVTFKGAGVGDHPPSIEFYAHGRYFTVTNQSLAGSTLELRTISAQTIIDLIKIDGPAFKVAQSASSTSQSGGVRDESGSAKAWRLAGQLLRMGVEGKDAIRLALHTDPDPQIARWMRDKGEANNGRQFDMLYEKQRSAIEPTLAVNQFTADQPAPVLAISEEVPPLSARVLSPTDCTKVDARRGYLIKGLIAPGDVTGLVGHPGAGKSVAAPHIGYAMAQGRHVFGLRTKPGKVLYACAEDLGGMKQRVAALHREWGDAPNFGLVDIGNLRNPVMAEELQKYVVEEQPRLVIIDTIGAAFAGLDENSSQDMGRVVAIARGIAKTGAAVMLIHHIAKAGDGSPRGHSVLNGTLDACLLLSSDKGIYRAKLTKNRNGPCDLDIAFRIAKSELGLDEDGDTITAPIAVECTAQEKLPEVTPTEKVALRVFYQIAPLSVDGHREIRFEAWRDGCVAGGISTSTTSKYQKQIAKVAIDGLVQNGTVEFDAEAGLYRAKPLRIAAEDEFQAFGAQPGGMEPTYH